MNKIDVNKLIFTSLVFILELKMAPFVSTMILINPNTAAIHPSFVNSAPGDTDLSFVGPSQILYSNDDEFFLLETRAGEAL